MPRRGRFNGVSLTWEGKVSLLVFSGRKPLTLTRFPHVERGKLPKGRGNPRRGKMAWRWRCFSGECEWLCDGKFIPPANRRAELSQRDNCHPGSSIDYA